MYVLTTGRDVECRNPCGPRVRIETATRTFSESEAILEAACEFLRRHDGGGVLLDRMERSGSTFRRVRLLEHIGGRSASDSVCAL